MLDIDNGSRFETYVIEGERGSATCVSTAPPRASCNRATV